jgi:hypothetical protein
MKTLFKILRFIKKELFKILGFIKKVVYLQKNISIQFFRFYKESII